MNCANFWWNWWVNLGVAVGTISAVVVALFGQAFRAKFFPPQLCLALRDPEGEATTARGADGNTERVRYYHLRVWNARRWSPAQGVQVVLLQLEEPGPDGRLQVMWRGDVPFGWRHQQVVPLARTIGAEADIDLCSIGETGRLSLHLLLTPNNLQAIRQNTSNLVLTVQARGNEGDSPLFRVKIAWDGKWDLGAAEMRKHMVIEMAT